MKRILGKKPTVYWSSFLPLLHSEQNNNGVIKDRRRIPRSFGHCPKWLVQVIKRRLSHLTRISMAWIVNCRELTHLYKSLWAYSANEENKKRKNEIGLSFCSCVARKNTKMAQRLDMKLKHSTSHLKRKLSTQQGYSSSKEKFKWLFPDFIFTYDLIMTDYLWRRPLKQRAY